VRRPAAVLDSVLKCGEAWRDDRPEKSGVETGVSWIGEEKAKPTIVELGVQVSGMQKVDEPASVRC
jgi:hypothetical protein